MSAFSITGGNYRLQRSAIYGFLKYWSLFSWMLDGPRFVKMLSRKQRKEVRKRKRRDHVTP